MLTMDPAHYGPCLLHAMRTSARLLQVARHDGLPPRLPRRAQAAGQGRHATAGPDHIVRPPPPPLCRPLAAPLCHRSAPLCTPLHPPSPASACAAPPSPLAAGAPRRSHSMPASPHSRRGPTRHRGASWAPTWPSCARSVTSRSACCAPSPRSPAPRRRVPSTCCPTSRPTSARPRPRASASDRPRPCAWHSSTSTRSPQPNAAQHGTAQAQHAPCARSIRMRCHTRPPRPPPPVQVALVPGEAFGAPATIRLSYAATRANIGDAVAKLAKFLGELN